MTPINALHRRVLINYPWATGTELQHRTRTLETIATHVEQCQDYTLRGDRCKAAAHFQMAFNLMAQQRQLDSYFTTTNTQQMQLAA